ncbi:hypothetical protein CB1_000371017 [Camelus ferus]|nr:hypothetical protein CB1_000371017 [Camelus ferus]
MDLRKPHAMSTKRVLEGWSGASFRLLLHAPPPCAGNPPRRVLPANQGAARPATNLCPAAARERGKSRGCFVFKPNFKKRKISVPVEDYFNKGKDESEDSKLRFETYQLIWQQMKSETELLLTTQFPFKLSEKVLQILTNIFLYHDFSIQNFIKGLQEETQSLLENLHVYHMNYFLVLRYLHQFTSSLPKYPLGRQSLLEMKELRRTSKKQTKFEVLREQVVNFIDGLVRECLLPPETQPLHEVGYFSAAHTLRERLNAAPRVALHTALNNPYYYLKNEALRSEEGCIPNVAPDICIAYKLHLECSRLINLVDWLEAFATVVTAAEKMDANSVTSEERNEIIQYPFKISSSVSR